MAAATVRTVVQAPLLRRSNRRVTDLGVAARRGRSRPETATGRRHKTLAGRLGLVSAT
jgi:hypothetical protein